MTDQYHPAPLAEVFPDLIAVAMGRQPADLIIRGASLVNTCTREVQRGIDVAVFRGRIALVGSADRCRGPETAVVEAAGRFLTPGFMDGHVHVESSMVTVTQYAAAVLPHGTTAVFMDPHEIANVLGLEGVRLMAAEGKNLPLRVYTTVPSCVPAAPGLEDAGAALGPDEIEEALAWDDCAGLGEMMNVPGVLAGDPQILKAIRATHMSGKAATGHYALPVTDQDLSAYAAAGINSCHESTRAEDALAKMRLGMYAMMREGSAWRDLHAVLPSLKGIDSRLALLVSDDTHPNTLLECGHLDHILRRAVAEGIDPLAAVQMVTTNTAACFGLTRDLGSIAPGKCADMVLLQGSLEEFRADLVFVNGCLVARAGRLTADLTPYPFPPSARQSVHLAHPLNPNDFRLTAPGSRARARVRVIGVVPEQTLTRGMELDLPIQDGAFHADPERDLSKLAVIERHHATGTIGLGLVSGFGLRKGASASTIAHDSHNLLVLGTNDDDMACAANALAGIGGGQVVVIGGGIRAILPLPIAGLMSDRPVKEVQSQVAALAGAWREMGSILPSPFMTMALLSLPVIPELRLTNRGLVDALRFQPVDLLVD